MSSSKHSGAAAPHRGADRSPPYPYRYTPPTSSRPSPTNPTFTDRFAGPTRRDDYQLPLHAGPPGDRAPPNLTASGWADRRPLSTASQSSAYGPYHSSSQHTSPYSAPSGPPSGSSHRSEDYHSALPPPPPPQHARESMHEPHSYPPTRDYPYEDSRYDSPRWDEHPRPPYSSYTAPSPSAPRDNPSRTFDPHSSASAPPGHHGYPAGDGYSSHYSNLPPIHYDRDEPPRKRRGNLPRWITDLLKAWFLEHIAHPYPSEQEKNELCMQTGCSMTQVRFDSPTGPLAFLVWAGAQENRDA